MTELQLRFGILSPRCTAGRARPRASQAGTCFSVATGGGGGYGDPRERSVELVQRDVIRGFVSPESARDNYGVVIEADGKASRRKDKG